MIDKVNLRKIKYDVLDMLELTEFAEKIGKFINEKEQYKDDLDYPKELIRKANLDISLNNIDDIVEALTEFVESLNDISSIMHYSILDYLQKLNVAIVENHEESKRQNLDKLKSFVLILEQVHLLQAKLLENSANIINVDDEGNIYDSTNGELMFDAKVYRNGRTSDDMDQIFHWALEYFVDFLLDNQRTMLTRLDFDDDGYFVSMSGENYFDDEDKKLLNEKVEIWIDEFYPEKPQNNISFKAVDENFIKKPKDVYKEDFLDMSNISIDDDVTLSNNKLTKESRERMSKLKDVLKASSNKINK